MAFPAPPLPPPLRAELAWTPAEVQQAEDRCHRIGQSCSVNIQFLLVKKSIDDVMWDSLQVRRALRCRCACIALHGATLPLLCLEAREDTPQDRPQAANVSFDPLASSPSSP